MSGYDQHLAIILWDDIEQSKKTWKMIRHVPPWEEIDVSTPYKFLPPPKEVPRDRYHVVPVKRVVGLLDEDHKKHDGGVFQLHLK